MGLDKEDILIVQFGDNWLYSTNGKTDISAATTW